MRLAVSSASAVSSDTRAACSRERYGLSSSSSDSPREQASSRTRWWKPSSASLPPARPRAKPASCSAAASSVAPPTAMRLPATAAGSHAWLARRVAPSTRASIRLLSRWSSACSRSTSEAAASCSARQPLGVVACARSSASVNPTSSGSASSFWWCVWKRKSSSSLRIIAAARSDCAAGWLDSAKGSLASSGGRPRCERVRSTTRRERSIGRSGVPASASASPSAHEARRRRRGALGAPSDSHSQRRYGSGSGVALSAPWTRARSGAGRRTSGCSFSAGKEWSGHWMCPSASRPLSTSVSFSKSLARTSCPRNITETLTLRSSSNLGRCRASCGLCAITRSVDMSTPLELHSEVGSSRSKKQPRVWPESLESSLKKTSPRMSSYRNRKPFWSRPPRSSSPFRSQRSSADAASRPTGFSGREYESASNLPKSAPSPSPEMEVRSCTASKCGPPPKAGQGSSTSIESPKSGRAVLAAVRSVSRDWSTFGSARASRGVGRPAAMAASATGSGLGILTITEPTMSGTVSRVCTACGLRPTSCRLSVTERCVSSTSSS
mmetsp:Transcript_49177/g.164188  ORF Transcript_49177/g.164188 Transcript_49177/m.164188 type:complete len:553 (+) Transcript_49177:2316-3974(+)